MGQPTANQMTQEPARIPASKPSGLDLNITTGKGDDEALAARGAVSLSDVRPACDETWLKGQREGKITAPRLGMKIEVIPGQELPTKRLRGYSIRVGKGQESYQCRYPITSLSHVARRVAADLPLGEDGKTVNYDYSLSVDHCGTPAESPGGSIPLKAEKSSKRWDVERGCLRDYLARSEPLAGPSTSLLKDSIGEKEAMPIFVKDEEWNQGHDLARRGGELESAAVLTGRLLRDVDSPEIFMVIDACLEAEHAEEEAVSLTFTGDTWARVRQRLEQRRQRLNSPNEIFLGTVHGHNFFPVGASSENGACATCEHRETCLQSTASASTQDFDWHRSVFGGQPWALLAVWGWNVRRCEDWRVYGLAGGQMTQFPIRRLQG